MTNDEYIKALKTKDLGKLANYFWDTFMIEPAGSTKREVANARFCLLPKTIKNKLDQDRSPRHRAAGERYNMLKAIAAVLVVLLVAAGLTSFVSKHMRQDLQETVSAAYTETRADQLWCRAEIQHQLESVEDTALISIDDIMFTYQVCVDNTDEFPTNAFGATTP